ncbi:hypothetical protein [Burkholderia sp. Ac-20365]|uniref:hypothetical protein n=1 Tax=Burkholderia sp. Ac-20365 TaxID=2703897 RepID=UPI00197B5A2F|nr:hypothetical protein [Burkholderia sp. Ac-20365]MBN3765602.1 hypothetical protein [Burkholderia sp. Ac-20365]
MKKLLDHKDGRMTRRYAKARDEKFAEAVALPDRRASQRSLTTTCQLHQEYCCVMRSPLHERAFYYRCQTDRSLYRLIKDYFAFST